MGSEMCIRDRDYEHPRYCIRYERKDNPYLGTKIIIKLLQTGSEFTLRSLLSDLHHIYVLYRLFYLLSCHTRATTGFGPSNITIITEVPG